MKLFIRRCIFVCCLWDVYEFLSLFFLSFAEFLFFAGTLTLHFEPPKHGAEQNELAFVDLNVSHMPCWPIKAAMVSSPSAASLNFWLCETTFSLVRDTG